MAQQCTDIEPITYVYLIMLNIVYHFVYNVLLTKSEAKMFWFIKVPWNQEQFTQDDSVKTAI